MTTSLEVPDHQLAADNMDQRQLNRVEWVVRAVFGVVLASVCLVVWLAVSPSSYSATSSVYVKSPRTDAAAIFQRGLYEQNHVQSYATLAGSTLACRVAATQAGIDISPEDLAREVSVQVLPQTVIIAITVEDASAGHAQILSNALAQAVVDQGNAIESTGGDGQSPVTLVVSDQANKPSHRASPDVPRIAVLSILLGALASLVAPLPRRRRRPLGSG